MNRILLKIPFYKLWRKFGFPKILPMNLTISPSFSCNSRCQTCNAWRRKSKEMTNTEWDKVFKSLGRAPFWVTISGGEPFLKKDLVGLVKIIYKNSHPRIINIPTNGLLFDIIPHAVDKILAACPKSEIIINVSLDGIKEKHDRIRRIKGNFDKTIKTYQALRGLSYPNFTLGIHTVISKFNVKDVPEIYQYTIKNLKPDQYITEIAEERVELGTIDKDIAPSPENYLKTINFLAEDISNRKWGKISKITQSFRLEYYNLVKKILIERKQIIPCYAGFASAQIAPNGDVWPCCIKSENMGNLPKNGYNFRKIWFSKKANMIRNNIKRKKCFCPLANASYTNMLLSPKVLSKIARRII